LPPVEWDDVVVSAEVEQELRLLVDLLNRRHGAPSGIKLPTGLLLIGPPGSGKTMLARLLATQAHRSFYPITPADVLSGAIGGSVKKLREVFSRARENAPSIVFIDELDGLFPRNSGQLSAHDAQVVEQALIEISGISDTVGVFLIGTTNDIDRIDPRLVRGGRFSDKIIVGLPDRGGYMKLLGRCLGEVRLADGLTLDSLAGRFEGITPADLEAVCDSAKRYAFQRSPDADRPHVISEDFRRAMTRVCGAF
jgi:SpoVK/Ycf46/Vps4 family AAA+-type ATPase